MTTPLGGELMLVDAFRRGTLPPVLGGLPGLLLLGLLCGCGSDNPYKTVKISGKVTYEDGSLIQAESIGLVFAPQVEAVDAKTHPRNGSAVVNVADGTFSCATTFAEYGDGLIPGEHKVAVQPTKDGAPVAGLVPNKYLDPGTTDLKITVEPAMGPLELKIPKP